MDPYEQFKSSKRILAEPCGFDLPMSAISSKLFPFQRDVARFELHRGKGGSFLHTGLGKGPIQMEVCSHWSERAKGDTLIAAPLAVAQQFKRESLKFNYDVALCKSQDDVKRGVNVTNYDRLHLFDLSKFVGVSLDESSCIKDWTSKTTKSLIDRLANTRYKLASSATPSPNDHAELGTHAELLEVMTRTAMLAMFFEHDGGETSKWALKGHGKKPFFKFCASWCVCVVRIDFMLSELYRATMPGRLIATHCMNIPLTIERDDVIGIYDFRGDIIRAYGAVGMRGGFRGPA